VDICNGTDNCKFTADPFSTDGFKNNTDCIRAFGDGYSHEACNSEETLFDGFDAVINVQKDCSPFFNTTCTIDFGNEDCKPGCDTKECLWDGYDCRNNQRPKESLTGVVVVELKGELEHPIEEIQKNISLMLRSMVNLTEEDNINSTE
jgi:Notch-like protein